MADQYSYIAGQDGLSQALPVTSAENVARREALMGGLVTSLHEHPVRLPHPLTESTWQSHLDSAHDVLATDELLASTLSIVVANCFSVPRMDYVRSWAESIRSAVTTTPGLSLALTRADIPAEPHAGGGHTRVILGLEDLGAIGSELASLHELFEAGVRMAGVAYNSGSALGCGLAQIDDSGLTAFGRSAIDVMNERGIVVDVSHSGDRTAIDAAEHSDVPVVISHAGARGLFDSLRMKPDDVIRAVASRGGVIGIEAAPGSTRTNTLTTNHTVDDVIQHIEYCTELVGIDCVALGGDSFYGDHVGIYHATGSRGLVPEGAAFFDGALVEGAENPTEIPLQVCAGLLNRGWSDADIAQILGGNTHRVLQAGLPG